MTQVDRFADDRRWWRASVALAWRHGFGFLLALVLALPAQANKESTLIDCDGAPAEAVLDIGHPRVAQWAEIKCTRYGHLVVPTQGYFWTLHGGYLPVVLAAQKFPESLQPAEVGHAMYFTAVTAIELDADSARMIEERARFEPEASLINPTHVYELTVTSVNTEVQTIYLLESEEKTIGAMPYPSGFKQPVDNALLPFIVIDIEKQRKEKELNSG